MRHVFLGGGALPDHDLVGRRVMNERCGRCKRTALEAGTAILNGICGDCADDLRDEDYDADDRVMLPWPEASR